jgi:serine protease Do
VKVQNGVKVTKVNPGKFKDAGIKEGLIITSVDKKKVNSPNDVDGIIQDNKTSGVLIEGIYPDGQRVFYAIGE